MSPLPQEIPCQVKSGLFVTPVEPFTGKVTFTFASVLLVSPGALT